MEDELSLDHQLANIVAEAGDVEDARALIREGANVDTLIGVNGVLQPLITIAGLNGDWEMVQLLVAHDANLEKPNSRGKTPAMEIALRGPSEMLMVYAENGCNLEATNSDGDGLAHCAAQNLNLKGLELTVALGVPHLKSNHEQQSPLDYARGNGKITEVETIFRNARPWPRLREGDTAESLTLKRLVARNEDQFCMLDHPQTWHKLGASITQVLDKQALLETQDAKGRPWLARGIECRQFGAICDGLHARGESLAEIELWVDESGKATPLLDVMVKRQTANSLFEGEFAEAFSLRELKLIYQAIPAPEQAQVPNYHQLVANKAREEKTTVREHSVA